MDELFRTWTFQDLDVREPNKPFFMITELNHKLLKFDNYTYAQVSGTRCWHCSTHKVHGCKAGIKMDYDNVTVVAIDTEHNHEPPRYKLVDAGRGCQMWFVTMELDIYWYLMLKGSAEDVLMGHVRAKPDWNNKIDFIPTRRGKVLLVHQGQTYFSMHSQKRWYCSKKQSNNCSARLLTTKEGKFERIIDSHNHQPPHIYKSGDGTMYKLHTSVYKYDSL